MSLQLLRRKFTVSEYHQMAEAGILTDSDRVELIRGEIVEMSPIGTRHAACVRRLNNLFSQRLRDRILIGVQDPIELDDSEPQPDIVLLQPRIDFYAKKHPQPEDIFLIIEVADTTVQYDREVKIPLYCENGIIEVWLVNINEECIYAYRQPTAKGYQILQEFRRGKTLSLQAFPDINITVDEILG